MFRVRCSTVFRIWEQVQYCSREKENGALLFSGERNWCILIYTGAILFLGEGNCQLVHYCSQEKEAGAILY